MPAIAMLLHGAAAGGGGPAFKTITFNHTKVSGSDQTDFRFLISETIADLKTVANGGSVVNANHIRLATDSAGTSMIAFDTAYYDPTTGKIRIWGKYTLSHSVDTVLYLAYNDNGITTFQGDVANTWSGYGAAYHGSNGTTTGTSDLTGNGNTLTATGTPTVAAVNGVGGGVSLSATGQTLVNASASNVTATNTFTVESIFTIDSFAHGVDHELVLNSSVFASTHKFNFALDVLASGKLRGFISQGGGSSFPGVLGGTATLSAGTLYYAAAVYNGSTIKTYLNGTQDGSASVSGNADAVSRVEIGTHGATNGGDLTSYESRADITRARSADWVATASNNYLSPSTFYTVT